jgi:ABC-type transport system involved in multi-copper enzyme maturation permease subunit
MRAYSNLLTLAGNSFRETLRDKILYKLVFFGLVLIVFSMMLGDWSLFAREKVMKDFTLAAMSVMGLLMSVFVGIGLIQKEIQRKTVLTLLAKPIDRWQFVVGKYLGLAAVLGVNLLIMTAGLYLLLWATEANPDPRLLLAIALIYVEMALILSVALMFSCFSTPVLSALFTFGFYVAGHLAGDILQHFEFVKRHAERLPETSQYPEWAIGGIRVIYHLLPNLENLNIRGRVVYGLTLDGPTLIYSAGYGLTFAALYLFLASWIFSRREFI